jgi:hypothetical protein
LVDLADLTNLPEERPWPLGLTYLQQFRDLILEETPKIKITNTLLA